MYYNLNIVSVVQRKSMHFPVLYKQDIIHWLKLHLTGKALRFSAASLGDNLLQKKKSLFIFCALSV